MLTGFMKKFCRLSARPVLMRLPTKKKNSTNIDEIKKAIVLALRKNSAALAFKINGEVISVPEPVYKGIHTGLLQLDPIMHNLSKVIESACRKAVREELNKILQTN